MSNAEMPPLAAGQVWVFGSSAVLMGDYDPWTESRLHAEGGKNWLRWREGRKDAEIVTALKRVNARLIHGPGAPWSPAEEVPHD